MTNKRRQIQTHHRRAVVAAKRLAYTQHGTNGVDFGYTYKRGECTRSLGVRFHVSRKLPVREMPPESVIPREIHGVPTDVLEASYSLHCATSISVANTLQPGVSIGNLTRATTGTLGLIVQDIASGVPGILSNWHVLCASPNCGPGEEITQPGPLDAEQSPPRKVAELMRWTSLAHAYDAAVATIVIEGGISNEVVGLHVTIAGTAEPQLGMRLEKMGIASGLSHGIVDGIEGSFRMDYSDYGEGVYWMDGMHIVPEPNNPDHDLSLDGDSGAIWLDPQTQQAVGLHFGGENPGSPLAEYAVAHPMSAILRLLKVKF